MTHAEILSLRQATRAKLEDLIGRTSGRELSTEEQQMFTDLKAEGQRFASLSERYAALEEFDKGAQPSQIVRTLAAPMDKGKAAWSAFDSFLRTGKLATDVPLQIQQSPVNAGTAAAVPTIIDPAVRDAMVYADFPGQLGVTDYPRESTNPLVLTLATAPPTTTTTYVEGSAPTESGTPTFKQVTLGGKRYANLTKVSLESLANVAFDVAGQVTRLLGVGQVKKQSADFIAALKAAVQANYSACFVPNNGLDRFETLTGLIGSLSPIWGPGKFLINQTDWKILANQRDLQNRALIDITASTIAGRPYVLVPDGLGVDRLYYGNFNAGCVRSQSPLYTQRLVELYAEHGFIGYSSYQYADWQFLASLTLDAQPVLFTSLETAGS